MKQHLSLLLAAALFTASCNSQRIAPEQVPAVVVNTLKAQYANATGTEWEKKGTYYEADFDTQDGADVAVQIDASGKLLMQKQELTAADLPAGIQAVLQNQYKDLKLDEVERLQKDGAVYYQVELEGKGTKDKKLVLTAEGSEATGIAYWD